MKLKILYFVNELKLSSAILSGQILYFKVIDAKFGHQLMFTKEEYRLLHAAGSKMTNLNTEQHPGIMLWKWYSEDSMIRYEFQVAKYKHVYAWALIKFKNEKKPVDRGNMVFDGVESFRDLKKVIAISKKYINIDLEKQEDAA